MKKSIVVGTNSRNSPGNDGLRIIFGAIGSGKSNTSQSLIAKALNPIKKPD